MYIQSDTPRIHWKMTNGMRQHFSPGDERLVLGVDRRLQSPRQLGEKNSRAFPTIEHSSTQVQSVPLPRKACKSVRRRTCAGSALSNPQKIASPPVCESFHVKGRQSRDNGECRKLKKKKRGWGGITGGGGYYQEQSVSCTIIKTSIQAM